MPRKLKNNKSYAIYFLVNQAVLRCHHRYLVQHGPLILPKHPNGGDH